MSGKGKGSLIENDTARNDDLIRMKVETTIPFVMVGVAKEDTQGGTRGEFVRGCGG
jgi:hypothetical protein